MYIFEGGITAKKNSAIGSVVPSAWNSVFNAIEVGRAGNGMFSQTTAGNLWLVSNLYYAADGSFKYADTNEAWAMNLGPGNGYWAVLYAASGTAGTTASLGALLATKNNYTLALQGSTYQAGTGITFPATQNASSNANTLDDYEEGTWTPATTTANVVIATVGGATYTKVGRLVTAQTYVTVQNNTGAGLTYFRMTGLPFGSSPSVYHEGHMYYNAYAANLTLQYGYIPPSTTYCEIGFSAAIPAGTNHGYMFQFTYEV